MKNFNRFQVFSTRLNNKINDFLNLSTNEDKVNIPLMVSLEYLNFNFGFSNSMPQRILENEFKQFNSGVLQDIRNFILLCIEEEIPILDAKKYFNDLTNKNITPIEKTVTTNLMRKRKGECKSCKKEKEGLINVQG